MVTQTIINRLMNKYMPMELDCSIKNADRMIMALKEIMERKNMLFSFRLYNMPDI